MDNVDNGQTLKSSFNQEMAQQVQIPKQFENDKLGFVLLGNWKEWKHKDSAEVVVFLAKDRLDLDKMKKDGWVALGKAPFELNWQKNPYRFNDQKLLAHISKGLNFGIIGGYGNLRIIDVDDPSLIPYFKEKLGDTASQETGSGGMHFFIYSDYETNHVFSGERGEFRAKNYQVVCSPSMHPLGKQYLINDKPIKTFSKEEVYSIIEPFFRKEKTFTAETQSTGFDTSRSGFEYRRIIALLREGKSRDEIFSEMMKYSKWAEHGGKHTQYREDTYNNAKAFVDGEKNSYAQKQYLAQFKEAKAETNLSDVDLEIYTDEDLMKYQPKAQEWIIENQIPEQEIGLLVGKRQDRKTFTALHQALCLAFGCDCFGVDTVPEKKKILFLSEEDSINSLAGRIKILKKGMGLENQHAEIRYISYSGLKLDRRDKKFEKFEEILSDFKPDLIIVDTLQRFVTFEIDKDNQKISELFTETLRPMQRLYGCGWLLIHHVRKSPTGKNFVVDPLDEIRGGSELVNYCRFVLLCEKPRYQREGNGEFIVFRVLKMSNALVPSPKVISFIPENDGLKVVYEGEPEEILKGGQLCARAIKEYLFNEGIKRFKTKEINEASEKIGFKKSLISEGLSTLVKEGFLTKLKQGHYEISGDKNQLKLKGVDE